MAAGTDAGEAATVTVEKALSLLAEMEQRPTLFDLSHLVKAVRAVLEVHQKYQGCRRCDWCNNPPDCDVCAESYPCQTVRAVCEALEGRDAE